MAGYSDHHLYQSVQITDRRRPSCAYRLACKLASTFSLSESRKPDVLAEDSPNKCSLLEVITDLRIKLGCVVNWDFASKDKRIILPRLVQYFMFHGQKVPMSPRNLQICVVTNAAQRAADGYRR